MNGVADDRTAEVDDFLDRLEPAFERRLHVVGQLVDDVVFAEADAALLGELQGRIVGGDVEADHERVVRAGESQDHVGLGDGPDAGVQHASRALPRG